MSEDLRDPVAMAAARLEFAVEALVTVLSRPRPMPASGAGDEAEMVPRAEVAAMAERLDATIARLRLALAEELRAGEPQGEHQGGESQGE